MPTPLNNSLIRGFEILALITPDRQEITTATVVAELGLNDATAHRFLMTLESVGALVCHRKGAYSLGYRLLDLGQMVLDSNSIVAAVHPVLASIAEDIDESVMAARLVGEKIVCLTSVQADRPVSVTIRSGSRLDAHSTAHGKLWLAHMAPEALDAFLAKVAREKQTGRTITGEADLRGELEKVRERGFSTNIGEREADIAAVAVPVFNRRGALVVTLSVYGMLSRFDEDLVSRAKKRLDQAARRIASTLHGALRDGGVHSPDRRRGAGIVSGKS